VGEAHAAHEALGQRVPAEVYRVSTRRLSRCSAFAGYPDDCRRSGSSASATLAKNDPGVLAESDPEQRVSRGWYGSAYGAETSPTTMHGVPALVRARSICAAPVRVQ